MLDHVIKTTRELDNSMRQRLRAEEEVKRFAALEEKAREELAVLGSDSWISLLIEASNLIFINGELTTPNRRLALQAALDWFCDVSDVPDLSRRYFGTKDYAQFTDQRVDCDYGFSPSHGTVVFKVGLVSPSKALTEHEKETCVKAIEYLLDREAA